MMIATAIYPAMLTVEAFDAFALLPENRDRSLEFIAGKVVEVVSNPLSSNVAVRIARRVAAFVEDHDLGHVTGADGGYWVSGERYIPDVAYIAYDKQAVLEYRDGYVPNAPDLAFKVLSPHNNDEDMSVKIANYLAAGTMVVVVSPAEEWMRVFIAGQKVQILTINDTFDGAPALVGLRFAVKDIFPPKQQPKAQ